MGTMLLLCFPVYCVFSSSALNLVEDGPISLKSSHKLMLVDAAWEDICTMIVQKERYMKAVGSSEYS